MRDIMASMNPKDREIISYLRKNARMPLTSISKKTSIPISTIFDRLKANNNKTIYKHTALLNYNKLGFKAHANISLKVQKEDRAPLKDFLLEHPAINSAYRTDGKYDYFVEGVFRDALAMEQFLNELCRRFRIIDTDASLIIENLKRESFMSLEGAPSI